MGVVQPALYIPPDLEARLAAGTLIRIGSVVRDAHTKRIVKHLDEIPQAEQAAETAAKAAAKAIKSHKGIAAAVAGGVILIGGGVAYLIGSSRKKKAEQQSKTVKAFNETLGEYLDAAKYGKLNEGILERVVAATEAMGRETTSGEGSLRCLLTS